MAYSLTSATSVADLIDKIAIFAGTVGWTVRRNELIGANRRATLQKSGDNIHLYQTDTLNLRMNGSVGYDGGLAGNAQPQQAVSFGLCNVGTGPFSNVFMFASNTPTEHVYVVVEIASGVFRQLVFGELVKLGTWTGGTFFDASAFETTGSQQNNMDYFAHHRLFDNGTGYSSNFGITGGGVRCDVDGQVNYFAPFRRTSEIATPCASGGMGEISNNVPDFDSGYRTQTFYSRSANSVAATTPMQPVLVRVERGGAFWSDIGIVPNIRFMNMSRFAPGDEFTIGPDTWKVFPWLRKGNASSSQPYSQEYAFAFLKTV